MAKIRADEHIQERVKRELRRLKPQKVSSLTLAKNLKAQKKDVNRALYAAKGIWCDMEFTGHNKTSPRWFWKEGCSPDKKIPPTATTTTTTTTTPSYASVASQTAPPVPPYYVPTSRINHPVFYPPSYMHTKPDGSTILPSSQTYYNMMPPPHHASHSPHTPPICEECIASPYTHAHEYRLFSSPSSGFPVDAAHYYHPYIPAPMEETTKPEAFVYSISVMVDLDTIHDVVKNVATWSPPVKLLTFARKPDTGEIASAGKIYAQSEKKDAINVRLFWNVARHLSTEAFEHIIICSTKAFFAVVIEELKGSLPSNKRLYLVNSWPSLRSLLVKIYNTTCG